jgi:hypothetical protein
MYQHYSLTNVPHRLAVEGEELVAHRFPRGSIAMVSRSDFERWRRPAKRVVAEDLSTKREPPMGFWHSIKASFLEFLAYYGFIDLNMPLSGGQPGPVVGIPSGALLRVFGIAPRLQDEYHLHAVEEALSTEISSESGLCNALCFGNGAAVPLQLLREGQTVKVIRRSWLESLEPAPAPVRVRL